MSTLTGNNIKDTYQGLLKLADSSTGITQNLQYVQDGLGNNTALQISETEVNITGSLLVNGVQITNGSSGTSGTSGQSGSSGTSGQSGSNGTSGSSGVSGSSGTSGSSGQSGTSGTSGSSGTSSTNAESAQVIKLYVKNQTGGQLDLGKIVRITGSTGDNAIVGLADWSDDQNSANTLGIVSSSIANDDFGYVITTGRLIGINTSGMTAGDMLYLSSSGQFTNVIPPAPYHEVRLGQVLRPQQNNGSMYVSIINGFELDELHDVDITSPVVGDLLVYRSGSYGQWVNETGVELGFANTGSNTFTGQQNIQTNLNVTQSLIVGGVSAFNDQLSLNNNVSLNGDMFVKSGSQINFNIGDGNDGAFYRLSRKVSGVFGIVQDPGNYHILDISTSSADFNTPVKFYSGITSNVNITGNTSVSGTTTLNGNTLITGSLYVSSSVSNDVTVDGKVFIFSNSTGANAPSLVVSSSLANGGISTIAASSIVQASGSLTGTVSRSSIVSVDAVSAPTTTRYIGISANPSTIGAPSLTGTTVPSIIAMNNSSQPEAIVNFQHRGGYTDGRMTILKPVVMNSGSFITGSVSANVLSIPVNFNTGSLDLNLGNFFTLQLTGGVDTHVNPTNIKPGQTINIEVNTIGGGTVSFPSSVKQVSGSLYVPTTTTGKDIITLISFDNSSLYLSNVKNLV